jgi:hypothetical protein
MNFSQVTRNLFTPAAIKEAEALKLKHDNVEAEARKARLEEELTIWHSIPATRTLMKTLNEAYNDFIEQAKNLASDGKDSTKALIQAKTIEKVIKYARDHHAID